jgi:hypothetical protein
MIAGRLIGMMLAVLVGMAGCASSGGGSAAPSTRPAPVTADPSQIFSDVPQSP